MQRKCHWCAHLTFKLRGATTPDSGSGLSTSQARSTLSVPPLGADPEVTFFSPVPPFKFSIWPGPGIGAEILIWEDPQIPDSAKIARFPIRRPEIGKSGDYSESESCIRRGPLSHGTVAVTPGQHDPGLDVALSPSKLMGACLRILASPATVAGDFSSALGAHSVAAAEYQQSRVAWSRDRPDWVASSAPAPPKLRIPCSTSGANV